jgi:hypothetical protein
MYLLITQVKQRRAWSVLGWVTATRYICFILKVPLQAKIVQTLLSQIHKNYGKYTFQIFTVDGITIAYQIESMA